MSTGQREYETTFIVNSNLEDNQIESVITRYQEFIKGNGGEVASVDRWGRRRLAYPIKKKNAGFYVQLFHRSPTDIVSKLEQTFKLDEDVIRHLTVVVDKNMQKSRAGIKKHTRRHTSKGEPADVAAAMVGKDHDEKQ